MRSHVKAFASVGIESAHFSGGSHINRTAGGMSNDGMPTLIDMLSEI